jgi:hypothetical protein
VELTSTAHLIILKGLQGVHRSSEVLNRVWNTCCFLFRGFKANSRFSKKSVIINHWQQTSQQNYTYIISKALTDLISIFWSILGLNLICNKTSPV